MQHVDVRVHDGVATVLMERESKHAALDPSLLQDLRQAISDVHQEKRVRAMVLASRGETFCSGVDLGVLHRINELPEAERPGQWFEYWRQVAETCEDLLRLPKPAVAAVDGACLGAGLSLILACDLVIASNRSRFSANASRWGLVGGTTAALLAFRFGGAVASRLALTGASIDAEQARELGWLGSSPVPPDQVWVQACECANRAASGSPEAVAATKRLVNETVGEQLMSHLAGAAAASATLCSTESAQEGVRAFVEKRDPKWT
ncbi:MAG: enoyl-CoA hydratase/isomerase family protein [Planctomycetota bacterium]